MLKKSLYKMTRKDNVIYFDEDTRFTAIILRIKDLLICFPPITRRKIRICVDLTKFINKLYHPQVKFLRHIITLFV